MRYVLNRLKTLIRRRKHERDLQDELKAHLQMDAQERMEAGAAPEDARRDSHREFGNVLLVAEDTRSTWGWTTAEQWLQDARYGLRNLVKRPGFTAVTVLTLGLGIGANTAIFSIINAALLRPLPFPEPDRLVSVVSWNPAPNGGPWIVGPADFHDWREQATSFQQLTAYSGGGITLWTGDRPETIPGVRVTWDFFETMGVAPMLGRGFEQIDELNPPSNQKIVLSHRAWLARFGGDPGVIGKQVKTAATPGIANFVTIVGVMPPEFKFPDFAEVWIPMGCCGEMTRRATRYWQVVGRLRDGRSVQSAEAEMESIAERLAQLYPESRNWSARVIPLDRSMVQDVRQALWILMGAVGFVIVIACMNIAGLTLVRSASRRQEVGVRLALGSSRLRLVRQLFVEGVLVSLLGTVAGLFFARWSIGAFFRLLPQTSLTSLVRFRDSVHLDIPVLVFAVLLSALTALVLTLVPVRDSLKLALADSIRAGSRKTQTPREHRFYKVLVVCQFACALVLLAGAGLLIQSFVRMLNIDLGYDPQRLIVMSLPAPVQNQAFVDLVMERIKASPAVESAAVMSLNRFGQLNLQFNREDKPFATGDAMVRYSSITSDYFRVLRTRLIAGRAFESRDSAAAPGVAIINEKLAREYFPGEDPIGRRIVIAYNNQRIGREIVGVVSDIRQDAPGQPVRPEFFVHWPQLPWLSGTLVIRARRDTTSAQKFVQDAIWSVDKTLPASRAETLDQILSSQVATPRLYMILFGLFSVVAVVLAGLGIYGLLAYNVNSRTNEMAIRVAVGASRENVLHLVIGEGLLLALGGILIGLLGTLGLTRLMRSLLFEVSPTDLRTFGGVALLLLAVSLAACYIPARRAAKTDPAVALRHE